MKNEDCPLELKKTSEGKKTVCKDVSWPATYPEITASN